MVTSWINLIELVGSIKGKHKLVGNAEYFLLYSQLTEMLNIAVIINKIERILIIKVLSLSVKFNGKITSIVLHNDIKDK